jgi:predicted ATPase/DNA-binding XRE family transcriptional regulator
VSDFAALARRLRERAQLTQEELAERAGVSARTISDVERGLRSRVYADTAARLASALALDGSDWDEFVEVARGRASIRRTDVGGLPHPLTPLIGRDSQLDLLRADLQPTTGRRLVTITGFGGSGKTRVAVAAGQQLSPAYDGRVLFVPLDTLQKAEWLLDALASVFGTVPSSIPAAVGHSPTLLILDAFEHVLPAAPLLADLLHRTPGLRVLVTSRLPLRIAGEREVPLGPLPSEHAARLFLERARDLVPEFAPDQAAVAEICALTNGLPLPLELAAAHVRYLPITMLRDRLRSGLSDANRVVEDAVGWSVSSLSDIDRGVLTAVAMFVAGCSLDALRAVCPGTDALASLRALSDNSLVVLQRDDATPRWRTLDVVREVITGPGSADAARRAAYTDFYVRLVSELSERVGHEEAWYRMLAAEEPNIRTALGWAAAEGDANTLLTLATGLWLFWQARGALDEARRWLALGLGLQPGAEAALRLKALWGSAWLAYHQGDDDAAEAAGDELARIAEQCADDSARRNALTIAGMVAIARDATEQAVLLLTEALHVAGRLDQPWILATSTLNLALGQLAAGSIAPARSLLGEAIRRYEAIGDRRFQARSIGYFGLAALLDADPERARALFRQSLAAFRDLGESSGIAEGLAGLAVVAAATDQPRAAATLASAADRLRQAVAARELPLERRIAARYLGSAAKQIGRDAWDEAWLRGQELTAEEAVAEALDQNERPTPSSTGVRAVP